MFISIGEACAHVSMARTNTHYALCSFHLANGQSATPLLTINNQLPNHPLPTTHYSLPFTNYQLPTTINHPPNPSLHLLHSIQNFPLNHCAIGFLLAVIAYRAVHANPPAPPAESTMAYDSARAPTTICSQTGQTRHTKQTSRTSQTSRTQPNLPPTGTRPQLDLDPRFRPRTP
jgi:hypothetical protein